ncbi:MAG: IS1 family transposase, partial [bacterium]|nr:IS1 family transposase [bacterium]
LPICRKPPFCPNPDCEYHRSSVGWRYKKRGFYFRDVNPKRIQRYRCQRCGRHFSSQTFSVTYWLKRPEVYRHLFHRILACSALRQIAPEFEVSPSTIQRQVERLGRHCLLLHERLRPRAPSENLVLDGFRSFESGRYWPFDANLLVGKSHYIYGFNEAELRRSGSMKPVQRRKRAELEKRFGRADGQATRKAVKELISRVVPPGHALELWSDDHQAYPRALRQLADRPIHHRTISSKASRTPTNPLFPVNLADLLLRHTGANHKRETIAFSKRRQGAMYRAAIWMVWRNYVKSFSERRKDAAPAQQLGITQRKLSVREVL